MSTRLTVTLGVCVAAGLAAGIGLARPGLVDGATTPAAAPTGTAASPAPAPSGGGYGTPAGGNAPAPAPAPAAPATVTIADFAFQAPASVAPGAAVEVVNADGTDHTLTADGRAFDTGNLAGGGRASITAPAEPGTYRFFCAIHPSMEGTLTVAA